MKINGIEFDDSPLTAREHFDFERMMSSARICHGHIIKPHYEKLAEILNNRTKSEHIIITAEYLLDHFTVYQVDDFVNQLFSFCAVNKND